LQIGNNLLKRHKRPTIRDVARLAGVSEGAVSAVLNDRVGQNIRVSEVTQQNIHEAVRALGYIANPAARSLAGSRSNIIAAFTFEAIFPIDHRDFYYPFLIGIEQEAERQGLDLLLITGGTGRPRRNIYRGSVNRLALADGAILLGMENKHELIQLLDDEFPFVFIGRRDLPGDRHSYVMANYVDATAQIVCYLAQHNHQHMLYLQSTKDHEPSWDRLTGLLQGLGEIGQNPEEALIWTGEPGDLTSTLLSDYLTDGVTAIIAEDDLLGERTLSLARAIGLQCPADFSLAVLGDALSLTGDDHTWTMWKCPRIEMGAEAVRLLVQLLDDPAHGPYRTVLPCQFAPGDTVALRDGSQRAVIDK
jgi:DNA-binding LacI/PurR family transcriptional regulator